MNEDFSNVEILTFDDGSQIRVKKWIEWSGMVATLQIELKASGVDCVAAEMLDEVGENYARSFRAVKP